MPSSGTVIAVVVVIIVIVSTLFCTRNSRQPLPSVPRLASFFMLMVATSRAVLTLIVLHSYRASCYYHSYLFCCFSYTEKLATALHTLEPTVAIRTQQLRL